MLTLEQTVLALFKQLCFYHSSWLRWFTRVPCKRKSSNTTKFKRKNTLHRDHYHGNMKAHSKEPLKFTMYEKGHKFSNAQLQDNNRIMVF